MSNQRRKTWLDVARGLAMLFVIFGHVSNELGVMGVEKDFFFAPIVAFINPIKVPMFFAISGYLFHASKSSVGEFAKRTLKNRLLPYVIWGSVAGILAFLMDFYISGFDRDRITELLLSNYIIPLLRGNLIWFIPCLIVVEIIFYIICRIAKEKVWIVVLLSALCTLAGYYLSGDGMIRVWKIDTALTCMQFMCYGMLIRRFEDKLERIKPFYRANTWAVYLFVLYCARGIIGNIEIDVNMGIYFHPIGFTIASMIGIYAFFELSKLLETSKALTFVGQNTFLYFVWHMYMAKLVIFIIKPILTCGIGMTLWAFIVCVLASILVAPVCMMVNRYFPWMVGRRKMILSEKGENGYD